MRIGRGRPEHELDPLRAARVRLHILEAVVTAGTRRDDVMALVAASGDPGEAAARLGREFGLDEIQSLAVLDMQVRRFSAAEVERAVAERDHLVERIRDLTS